MMRRVSPTSPDSSPLKGGGEWLYSLSALQGGEGRGEVGVCCLNYFSPVTL